MAISTISFIKTPQAVGDAYLLYEDQLLGLTLLDGKIVALDVMSNDLGGAAKALYSVDDGLTYTAVSSPNDLLLADALASGKSAWEAAQSTVNGVQSATDDVLRIDNGKIDLDIGHSLLALTGMTDVNALAAGDHIHDSFVYAIRLGNGTLSWATTTVDVYGQNDAASISGAAAGTLTEDDTNPVTGTLTVTDTDHGESHTQTARNAASLGGLGTYSVDADGHWSYTVNTALVQYLNVGESTTDSFVATSLDGTAHQTVTIEILGVNDAAILSSDTKNLTETNSAADISTSGTLTISDIDSPATFVTQGGTLGSYGTFAIDAVGAWTYTASSAHNEFVGGTTYTDTFSVASADGTLTSVAINILGTSDAVGPLTFSETLYASGSANWVSTGDLDGDGHLDLVYSVPNSWEARVLMNQGEGTFLYAQSLYAPYVEGLTIADVNSDSAPDVITGDTYYSAVGVHLNDGTGLFEPYYTANEHGYAVGPVVPHVETFDVNEDGELDIIASSYYDGAMSVLLGNGDGTFEPRATFGVGGVSNYGFAVADLGNGHGDIVLANANNNQLYVMMGDGTGHFSSPATINTGHANDYVTVADLGDGHPDLIVGNLDNASISVYRGHGDGTFDPAMNYSAGNAPVTVAAADMNNDGILDLVSANAGSSSISIFLGNNDETFQSQIEIHTEANPFSLTIGDFNSDSLNDVSYTAGNGLHVLLNTSDFLF